MSKLSIKGTEIKYLLFGVVLLAGLMLLSTWHVFDIYEKTVDEVIRQCVHWGMMGVFISALLANSTVVISVPYSLTLFTVVLFDQTLTHSLMLGAAAGLGAGLGRLISYSIARRMASRMKTLPNSTFYRKLQNLLSRYPNRSALYLFLGALSFLPDEIVITPVALLGISVRKATLPIIAGKFFHTLLMIGFVMLIGSQILSDKSHPEIILAVVLITILIIFYQIDKARSNQLAARIQQPVTVC